MAQVLCYSMYQYTPGWELWPPSRVFRAHCGGLFFDYGTSKGVVSHRRVFYAFRRVFKINRGVELPIDEPAPVSFSHDRVSSVNIL